MKTMNMKVDAELRPFTKHTPEQLSEEKYFEEVYSTFMAEMDRIIQDGHVVLIGVVTNSIGDGIERTMIFRLDRWDNPNSVWDWIGESALDGKYYLMLNPMNDMVMVFDNGRWQRHFTLCTR